MSLRQPGTQQAAGSGRAGADQWPPCRKPSDGVKPDDELALDTPEKFVSRGGRKLEHALEHFKLEVTGLWP